MGNLMKISKKWLIVLCVFLTLFIGFFTIYEIRMVDSAEIGILVNRTGDKRGVSKVAIKSGWIMYNSFTHELHTYPAYAQIVDYSPFDIQDKKGTIFHADPTIEYFIPRDKATQVFLSYRKNVNELNHTMILAEVKNAYKDVSGLYETDSLINHRPQFEEEVKTLLTSRLENKGIFLSDIQSSVKPNDTMQKEIDSKNASIQKALRVENERRAAVAEADKLIAIAKGEAEANEIVSKSITPTLLQWEMIKKWNGVSPQVTNGGVLPTFSVR
jgi:regulator of protease activity HflC (stomatin/prohibitin superfamily)